MEKYRMQPVGKTFYFHEGGAFLLYCLIIVESILYHFDLDISQIGY